MHRRRWSRSTFLFLVLLQPSPEGRFCHSALPARAVLPLHGRKSWDSDRLLDFYSRMEEILAKTKKIPQLLWLSFTVVTRSLFLSKCRYDGNKTLGLLREQYHKTQEWYRLFIIKALLTRCEWIFSCYVLENTKRGHPLGKDLTAFSDVPFPLAAWAFWVIFFCSAEPQIF